MSQKVKISKKFNGPPYSGNGGYVCGLLAKYNSWITEVTLHKPPPLDTDLELVRREDALRLMQDDLLIASGKPGVMELNIPAPPSFEDAELATGKYIAQKGLHIFPTCFVCGPQRKPGDGLRIFTGQVDDTTLYAAPWIPDVSLADDSGIVKTEIVWASLDCPGYFALTGDQIKPMVLGRMVCEIINPVYANEQYVITAWPLAIDGRKHFCGTAIFNSSNQLCAKAKAVWISIDLKTI